jgi:cytidylate kinase
MIITVDGLPASGKGTLARRLGEIYNLPVLDTGALWRVLAFQLSQLQFTVDVNQDRLEAACHRVLDQGLDYDLIDQSSIRTEHIGQFASVISGFQKVRDRVDLAQKRWLVDNGQRGILDGRETGVSIAPHADHKFFLMATVVLRAIRRANQLGVSDDSEVGKIMESIQQRDAREITRRVCPVRPAHGALVIDTTSRGIQAVVDLATGSIDDRMRWETYSLEVATL